MFFSVTPVVLVTAVIEVVGVAAFAIAAAMQNQPFGLTVEEDEGGTMSGLLLDMPPVSISWRSTAAFPFPAFVWGFDSNLAGVVLPRSSSDYNVAHRLGKAS